MKNSLKESLEKEIKNFFSREVSFQYIEKNPQNFDPNVINLCFEEIKNNCKEIEDNLEEIDFEETDIFNSTTMCIQLEIVENQKIIYITNILFSGKFAKNGLGKKIIKLIYEIGKKNKYRTILYDMVNSFFNSMRRRKAKVININNQDVEITDETDLESKRNVPKPFTPEILKYSKVNKVKKEFLPFNSETGIEYLLFNSKRVEELLSNLKFDQFTNNLEQLVLIPVMELQYILNTYFDNNDPFSLDKELCELFNFVIHKDNPIISLLEKVGTEYTILADSNSNEFCTFSTNYYTGYEFLTFKNKKELENKMVNLSQILINILYFAKFNNKLSFIIKKVK